MYYQFLGRNVFVLACIAFQFIGTTLDDSELILKLPNGRIRGHYLKAADGNIYRAFQGVPYASPPVGDLRFKEAIPPENWSGILDTTESTKICLQAINPNTKPPEDPRDNEDCLYANVYTPSVGNEGNQGSMPVLVYIYGGMFTFGDPTIKRYNFQEFMKYGIVAVTFSFRSGPLGFLSTQDGVIPGNLGLKDQTMALKWISENIKFFGGDPSKVTLVGHSSGAACVAYHVISERSHGLFRSAIIQSSTAIAHFSYQKYPRYWAYSLGESLSPSFTSKNSSKELLALLKSVPGHTLMQYWPLNYPAPHLNNSISHVILPVWAPVIENGSIYNAFVTEPMHNAIQDGRINRVPIMLGITEDETYDGLNLDAIAAVFDRNRTAIINNFLNVKEENKEKLATEIKLLYSGLPFQQDKQSLSEFMGDTLFHIPSIRHADLQSAYSDVYFYQFSYFGPMNMRLYETGKAKHTDELPYLYHYPGNPSRRTEFPDSDIITRKRLLTLWTNFIKYTNPTPSREPLLQNIIWPKVSPGNFQYLDINKDLKIMRDPKRYSKWSRILEKYVERPTATVG